MSDSPGFEGAEKKIKVGFTDPTGHALDLRRLSRDAINEFLEAAHCTIIGSRSTRYFDSYVLSESSLFVYPEYVILKTCGTTSLLASLPAIVKVAATIGAEPTTIQFSRAHFMFPTRQPYPHQDFNQEVEFLDRRYDGHGYILGALNGPRWHFYTAPAAWANALPSPSPSMSDLLQPSFAPQSPFNRSVAPRRARTVGGRGDRTLEILMFQLDPAAMAHYYQPDPETKARREAEIGAPWDGAAVTNAVGIDVLMPGAGWSIDSHLFQPCGYSCNGLNEHSYFTIHITPEPHCSFVSFETNARMSSKEYTALIRRVVRVFRPAHFSVSLNDDDDGDRHLHGKHSSRRGCAWEHPGFVHTTTTHHVFDGTANVTVGQFKLAPSGQEVSRSGVSSKVPAAEPTPSEMDNSDDMDSNDGELLSASPQKARGKVSKKVAGPMGLHPVEIAMALAVALIVALGLAIGMASSVNTALAIVLSVPFLLAMGLALALHHFKRTLAGGAKNKRATSPPVAASNTKGPFKLHFATPLAMGSQ